MPEEEKPFVTTRGHASFNIMPRNAAGWLLLALWLLPALAISAGYAWIMESRSGDTDDVVVATLGFVMAMTVWAVVMTRWMYVRSEVVDLRKLGKGEDRPRDKRKP